jgi:hypothetical protein
MARHKSAIRVPQHPGMETAGIDNYRGVALGVESAWPSFVYGHKGKGANRMRSRIFAALGVALYANLYKAMGGGWVADAKKLAAKH